MIKGNVFNIQRFTLHDGPGIRTELFLKGCTMHCDWCSNPESQKAESQPGVYKTKCISKKSCGACFDICPENKKGMFRFYGGKLISIDRDKCTNCMKCVDECPSDAIRAWGKMYTVEDCMKVIRRDIGFNKRSDGGVTVSGGEPLVQADFTAALLKQCKEEGIHTCCESGFCVGFSNIEKVLPYTDLFITDIKHMDSDIHKARTGVGNELILENQKKLAGLGKEMIVRIPIIPGFNDYMENIEATADFIINELKDCVSVVQLLSFMRMGVEKYASIGRPYPMKGIRLVRKQFQKKIEEMAEYMNSRGINCTVGTHKK